MRKLLVFPSVIGSLSLAFCLEQAIAKPAIAQESIAPVSADGTLSTRVRSSDGQNFTIEQGDRAGSNLFHSFREFSVPTGGSVVFNNVLDVQNIFSRVTGSSISRIDGLVGANGTANLFLLNPNGILFGPNAQLNLGGSLIASTADRIRFADGSLFAARQPETSSLLTVSTPIGLQIGLQMGIQMENTPGRIAVNGLGNPDIVPTTNLGLVTAPGRSIALVGGEVNLQGGIVTAIAGRVEVGSVRAGEVSLQPTPTGWRLGYAGVSAFGDVQLRDRAALWTPDPLGNPFGGIQVQAQHLSLDNSQITTATLGAAPGGSIEIQARRSLSLGGVGSIFPFSSAIASQVNTDAIGRGGNIRITTPSLVLQDGALIQSATLGAGRAGNIQVNTDSLRVTGFSPLSQNPALGEAALLLFNSRIASETFGAGDTGNLSVSAQRVNLQQGGQVRSLIAPGATGNSGRIRVTVRDTLTAREAYPVNPLVNSGISVLNFGAGDSAGIVLQSDRLMLREGAMIFSFNQGSGQGGDITVNVRDRLVASRTNPRYPVVSSGINASTLGTGNGGRVRVQTGHLHLSRGAEVATYVLSHTELIEVRGTQDFENSDIGTYTLGAGNGGTVSLHTPQLVVRQGGIISSAASADGNAGNVRIQAAEILVGGRGENGASASISASADTANAAFRRAYFLPPVVTGDSGSIEITADRLRVLDRGLISVDHDGTGNAGRLSIAASRLEVDRAGQIMAATASGTGGNVNLQVQEILLLRDRAAISGTAGGRGNGGNLNLAAPFILSINNSDVIANAIAGRGGNIQIQTQGILGSEFRDRLTLESDITASSQFGVAGTVEITTPQVTPDTGLVELPTELIDASQQITTFCAPEPSNSFVITGRGGIPSSPEQPRLDRPWHDLRDLSQLPELADARSPVAAPPTLSSPTPLASSGATIEATTWQQTTQGQIELIASVAAGDRHATPITCAHAAN